MNQTQIRITELAAQQDDSNKVSLAPVMLLDDEALKHVAGGGPGGSWAPAVLQGPGGSW